MRQKRTHDYFASKGKQKLFRGLQCFTHNQESVMIDLMNMTVHFGNQVIFNHSNYHFGLNTIHCITGGGGSGKTTLVKILMNELVPDGGQILWYEQPLRKLTSTKLRDHRQHIGYVSEKIVFFLEMVSERQYSFSCDHCEKTSAALEAKLVRIAKKWELSIYFYKE